MTSASNSGLQEGGNTAILELPSVVSRAHLHARDALRTDAEGLKALDTKIRETLKLITLDTTQLAKSVQEALVELRNALNTHEAACKAVDAVESHGNGKPCAVEHDPWVTESLLAHAHSYLRACLQEERCCMDAAYGKLRELELERFALMAKISLSCFQHYKTASVTVHDLAVDLADSVQEAESQPELQRLMGAAEQAVHTSEELAARQADNLESVASELFCSPEILRQGAMEMWNASKMSWDEFHFVLTRSGFLHWFESTEQLLPLDGMNLSRCSIEAGEPPIFNMHENMVMRVPLCGFKDGHGPWFAATQPRRLAFKASDVEDCCEWVIAIREEISSKSVK